MINSYDLDWSRIKKCSGDHFGSIFCGNPWLSLQANAIINSLTASVNKVQGALADLNGQSKPHLWLMTYVQTTKDKQVGWDLNQGSTLMLPIIDNWPCACK